MNNKDTGTEARIVRAAYDIFLFYGYHGSTLQQIAERAGVNQSSIHYYFRSKDKLYGIVVELIIDLILKAEFDFTTNREKVEKPTWFLFTELYNNRILFEHTIKELHPDDWESKLKDLNNWLSFSNGPLNYVVSGMETK
jgi:AcrR family transcriptional regulator